MQESVRKEQKKSQTLLTRPTSLETLRTGRFDPHWNRTRQCGIKLPHGLALMFEGLLLQLACFVIQHRDRLLSSV